MNSSLIDSNLLNEDDSNCDKYQNDEKEDYEDDDDELTSDKTNLIYILEVLNFSNTVKA